MDSWMWQEMQNMCSGMSKDVPRKDSLTDRILKFCASGQFGVREAIAAAKMDEEEMKGRRIQAQERTQGEHAHTAA